MKALIAIAVLGVSMCAGCQNDGRQTRTSSSQNPNMMSTRDDCSHCAGMQTAKADGTCPVCGMKVK